MNEASLAFSNTSNGQAGSTRWAAPEQLSAGAPSSQASDVYALAMTILETFTGAVPYSHWKRDFQVINLVLQGTLPTRPNDKLQNDERGNRMWDLLVSCWNREADARPSALDVLERVSEIAGLGGYGRQGSEPLLELGTPDSTTDKKAPRRLLNVYSNNSRPGHGLTDGWMPNENSSPTSNRSESPFAYDDPDGPSQPRELKYDRDHSAQERIQLLSDLDRLDQEVYEGVILGFRVPSPMSANVPSLQEVTFSANLISLVLNEMWKCGLIKESEQFLANTIEAIQAHIVSFTGEDTIIPGVFWLSNVHEIFSFVCNTESDMMKGIDLTNESVNYDFPAYQTLIQMLKTDLDSPEYNIYYFWMVEAKKKLSKMIVPALIETQQLPDFTISPDPARLPNGSIPNRNAPAYNMDDLIDLLNKVIKSLRGFFMEESVIQQAMTELLRLVGVTSFNDLLIRKDFRSWRRGMQIEANIMRIEEWCKLHEMHEGMIQLEHLMQATKLLQLKKRRDYFGAFP